MTTVFSALPMPKGGHFFRRGSLFKGFLTPDGVHDTTPLFDPDDLHIAGADSADQPDLTDLNTALRTLTEIFPDVQPEVFREMLLNLSDESRVEVVTEHLLRDKAKWVQGRYKQVGKVNAPSDARHIKSNTLKEPELPMEHTIRSRVYKDAVKSAFYQEFRNLSRSTIKAVLAEQNYSYTHCRPVLQQLTSKSWRAALTSLFAKKRSPPSESDHPLVEWQADMTGSGQMLPCLRRTASYELNKELFDSLVAPVLKRQQQDLLDRDRALAEEMNNQEAEAADAMFECQCCYMPNVFEQITTCDTGCHVICFQCIRFAVNEALYGQGWARNINLEKSSIRCLAPALDDCQGSVPSASTKQALTAEKDDDQIWRKLEDRMTSESLLKSRLPLSKCPFCPYAELDEVPELQLKTPLTFIPHVLKGPPTTFLVSIMTLFSILFYPLFYLLLPALLNLTATLSPHTHTLQLNSRQRIARQRRGLKFTCLSPHCASASCSACLAPWTDPHTCHSTSLQSLRQAIESATTSAIKRTCPKCNLSFIKSSGCNKLVCNCGYTMCYVCRNEIAHAEGYAHFCQHFRERGGVCGECERCDLYVVEDEGGVVRRAAREAERAWREREGVAAMEANGGFGVGVLAGSGVERFGAVAEEMIAGSKVEGGWRWWTVDGVLDVVFEAVLA